MCVVSISSREALVDLIELDMVDFDVILGMISLNSCYVFLDFWAYKVMFKFHYEPIILWEGGSLVPNRKFILYLIPKS